MLKKISVLFTALALSSSGLFASGFSIYEQGAKATAMAGAFIAQANDVSSVFFNPAGMAGQDGFQVGLGTTLIFPQFSFTGPTGVDKNLYTKAEAQTFTPTTFYATYGINDDLAVGFGFFTLYGLGSKWSQDWVGRELATTSDVKTFTLNPSVAYKLMDNLSVSIGLDYVIGQVTLEKSAGYVPAIGDYVESKLAADATGFGFNLGVKFNASDELAIGAVYRSEVSMDFSGDATFDFRSTTPQIDAGLRTLFPSTTKGTSTLTLPALMGVGVSYDFTKNLTAEFDWMQIAWSSYDKLTIKFADPVGPDQSKETIAERNYEDSYSLRFGMEYRVNDELALRMGYLRDNKAVPDTYLEPSLPEGDRNLFSLGAGYKMGAITVDAFYMALQPDDRTITTSKVQYGSDPTPTATFNGTYKGVANLFGLSLSYSIK